MVENKNCGSDSSDYEDGDLLELELPKMMKAKSYSVP
jgi:hypothetical protein